MQISSSISIWSTNYIPVVSASGVSYFLDLYSAEYAYSLRQLGSTEVDVIRVRRSSDSAESDFNPTEISDGTLTTWTGANDGFVVTWYDQAGSNDFTQSTAGNQPKIVSSGTVITKDSLPAVSFDGTSDFLQGTIMSELESSPFSVFTVCNNGGNSLDANTMFSQRENGGAQEGFLMTTDRRTDKIGAYTDDSGAAYQFNYLAQHDNSDNRLQAFIINGSDQGELWLDSTSQDTNTHSSFSYTASQAPFIGKQDPGTNQYGQGKVQEIIVFGTDEGTDRSNIENNMNEAYNMFWNGQNTGLLDDYPAASAYSLRALNSSYTGALVRIRRSSDSAERDFYANWDGSFPSTDVENWVGAGNDGFVVTWYDQEESADMTQSTAANQPRIVNAGTLETKGGKTAVYFDGSNDYVSRTAFTSLYTYPFTIMGVSSNDASAAQGVVFSQRLLAGDQSGVSLFCDRRTNKTGFLLDEGSTNHQFNYTAQDNTANQRLQTFIIDSSGNGELWKDGTSQESIAGIGAFSTNPATVADIGRQQAGPLYIQGFVQELIVWGSTDQTSNRTDIETNINDHYSIY